MKTAVTAQPKDPRLIQAAGAVSDKKRDKSSHIFCPPLSRFVNLLLIY